MKFAHAAFVAFACLEDFYRFGPDQVKILGRAGIFRGRDEYFKFDYFFETAEFLHSAFRRLEKKHLLTTGTMR